MSTWYFFNTEPLKFAKPTQSNATSLTNTATKVAENDQSSTQKNLQN